MFAYEAFFTLDFILLATVVSTMIFFLAMHLYMMRLEERGFFSASAKPSKEHDRPQRLPSMPPPRASARA